MKTLSPESDPFSKERPNRLRVPQQRVLRALMPTDDGKTVPLTRIQLAERMGYTRKSGTITRALNGIQEGAPSGKPYLGLLDLGLVEEVELDGNKALQITPPGRKAVEELGELPKVKDKAVCTNHRYLAGTPLSKEEIIEGRRLLKMHKCRERNRQIVRQKKRSVLKATSLLLCEACEFDFAAVYGKLGEGFAECHHRLPLAEYDAEAPTLLEDLAIVCANCHRMLHRGRPMMTVEELRSLILFRRTERSTAGGGFMADRRERGGPSDLHNLNRFVQAQAADYERALGEIRSGRKQSHWMWYVFPQLDGLGSSRMCKRYSIKSLAEAEAYLAHPILGLRLRECAEAAFSVAGRSAFEIFGSPDDMKLKSCATLFACVSPEGSVFDRLLDRYYRGERDGKTLRLLGIAPEVK